jgi:hypothetical protein
MNAETALLATLANYLGQPGLLLPAAALLGVAEPTVVGELPALVMALPELRRMSAGLGERAAAMTGALAVTARIDLTNPVLPGEPGLNLLSADRRTLVLPHGGWVCADGLNAALAGTDLQVSVAGVASTVVNAAPGAGQVRPDAPVGTLLFGTPLPAVGTVVATYFVGQWERRTTPIAGRLHLGVRAALAADAVALSDALIDAMADTPALPAGLHKVALLSVSAVGAPQLVLANSRSRELTYSFEFDHVIDRADSSGGVIRQIPITTQLFSMAVEPSSGAITTALLTIENTQALP